MQIHGNSHERFARVRDAFENNFTSAGDVGASVAVTLEGEFVVDLWGGARDAAGNTPWQEDTIVNVYSTTKTMAAMTALVLADRGQIDLNAPVSRYWPEFAQNGKEGVEVRHFLSHSAGVPGFEQPCDVSFLYDWDAVVNALAGQAPWWTPGTASGYHAVTQGYLIGEVVRRVTGKSLGTVFREEIAEPTGADFHIGTPAEVDARIGELIPPEGGGLGAGDTDSIAARTFRYPLMNALDSRTEGWRRAEIPAANGHGNARAVVRAQTAMANGGKAFGAQILSEAGTRRVFEEQTFGNDHVLGVPIRFGMGYGLTSELMPMGPNPHIAYWGGWGGSSIVIDQDAHLCVSYVMNRMDGNLLGDRRGFSLLQAVYESL